MRCEQVTELEQEYLLGTLSRQEEQDMTQHLSDCPDCAKRLAASEEVLGEMFAALEPVPPPVQVRENLLNEVKPSNVIALPQIGRNRANREKTDKPKYNSWVLALGTMAAVLIVGLTVWVFSLSSQVEQNKQQVADTQQLLNLTASPNTITWDMLPVNSTQFDPTAPRARMFVRPDSPIYLVTAVNFQPPPSGSTYRVWYVESSQTKAAGSINPNPKGWGTLKVNDPGHDGANITSCFVTLESANSNAPQPTNPPLLEWKETKTSLSRSATSPA